MKYKVGQRIKNGWQYGDEEPDCEIVCLGIFSDGTWKYGILDDMAEYGNMIDFYTNYKFIVYGEIIEKRGEK